MLGAIIGDIVGSAYEFNRTNDYDFKMFTSDSAFTDDTVCTIAVADALLTADGFGKSIHSWCRRYPHPKGDYGGRFKRWVESNDPVPYNSFGNGSAMRVSPIGWWYYSRQEVLDAAKTSAECSHNHPEGVKGAQTIALAIFIANSMRLSNVSPQPQKIVDECVAFSGYDINIDFNKVRNHFDETCQGTVPVALAIIRDSKGFEDAIRRAVSLGADADTLGAIVGSIAEAIWGIPDWMKAKTIELLPTEMVYVLRKFRKALSQRRKEAKAQLQITEAEQAEAIMFWKLGLGNMGKYFNGEDPQPSKEVVAMESSWTTDPMPDTAEKVPYIMHLSFGQMEILRRGHIPQAQEDHWFMYTDGSHIRYFRSWTGMCAFEAHFQKTQSGYAIDRLVMNQALSQWGVNGSEAGCALFRYLIAAETGLKPHEAWNEFLAVRRRLEIKYRRPEFTPAHISELADNEIFVFGSNLAGMHGGGAAQIANKKFGAEIGVGVGLTGQCYAIPTMQGGVETIKPYVDDFIAFARQWPDITFLVTPIGCGIAGFTPEQIAPLFAVAIDIDNICLPKTFVKVINSL